jgi:DNA invertase Pin-like site-specific DNA recombinase
MEKKQAIIYARVSTHKQDFERQKIELNQHAKKNGFEIVATFEEKISGKSKERIEFTKMVAFAKSQNIHSVFCWELSRIGRNTIEVLTTIEELNSIGVNTYIHNLSLNTLESGKINLLTDFLLKILASVNDMESNQIKQRLTSGYIAHVNKGGAVGRPSDTKESEEKFLEKHKEVIKMLKKNIPIRVIMQITQTSSATVLKVKSTIKKNALG